MAKNNWTVQALSKVEREVAIGYRGKERILGLHLKIGDTPADDRKFCLKSKCHCCVDFNGSLFIKIIYIDKLFM